MPNFNIWFILYLIENSLYILMGRKNFCMLHAGAIKKKQNAQLIFGPQGTGKTYEILKKINYGYDFLGDEYVFINNSKKCLAYPRKVNFKKYHEPYYKLAFTRYWHSINFNEKLFLTKEFLKTLLFRSNWKPLIRLKIRKVFPRVSIVRYAYINSVISKFNFAINNKNKTKLIKHLITDIQYEMLNRFKIPVSCFKKINDKFMKKFLIKLKKLSRLNLKY